MAARRVWQLVFVCLIACGWIYAQSVDELERTRNDWQKPSQVLDHLGIKAGLMVADVGAGSGYFTFRLSNRVGPTGRVYAVDTNPAAIAWLNVKAREFRAKNVIPVQSKPDNPMLAAASLDVVLIVDTFHEFSNPQEMLNALGRAMKPEAVLCIIDTPFAKTNPKHSIAKETVVRMLEENSFTLTDEPGFLPRQFMLIFRKTNP